jgi:hypothetical protein
MAIGPQEMHVVKPKTAFYLAASHRQIKNYLLCVLCASAVKILFWTRMILAQNIFASGVPWKTGTLKK